MWGNILSISVTAFLCSFRAISHSTSFWVDHRLNHRNHSPYALDPFASGPLENLVKNTTANIIHRAHISLLSSLAHPNHRLWKSGKHLNIRMRLINLPSSLAPSSNEPLSSEPLPELPYSLASSLLSTSTKSSGSASNSDSESDPEGSLC